MNPEDLKWEFAAWAVEVAKAIEPPVGPVGLDLAHDLMGSVGLNPHSPLEVHGLMIKLADLYAMTEIIATVSGLVRTWYRLSDAHNQLKTAMVRGWGWATWNVGLVAGVVPGLARAKRYGFDMAKAPWDKLQEVSLSTMRRYPEAYALVQRRLEDAHAATSVVKRPSLDQLELWPYCTVAAIQLMLAGQKAELVGQGKPVLAQAGVIGELIRTAGWMRVRSEYRRFQLYSHYL